MKLTAEFMLSVILALGSGAGAYTAIRADLATLHERTAVALDTAKTANQRIDALQAQQNK